MLSSDWSDEVRSASFYFDNYLMQHSPKRSRRANSFLRR